MARSLRLSIRMFRQRALVLAFTVAVSTASAHGQSAVGPIPISELRPFCEEFGRAEIVFVGRAEAPVTFRISGEAEIENARQHLTRTEAEVARLRASLDLRTRWEREGEFALRLIEAQTELDQRQGMYPSPYDLTLLPVSVERAFRGVTEPSFMLHLQDPSMRVQPGELYLVSGYRSADLIPPLPEIADLLPLAEYVEGLRVMPVASARQELRFLASTVGGGATILGNLSSQYGGVGASLSGIRIVVSSETQRLETATRADGSFSVSGIQAGRLTVRPLLSNALTVVNKSAQALDVREGGCAFLDLTIEVRGGVRGRVLSATGTSLEGMELSLRAVVDPHNFATVGSHSPHRTARPGNDGSFELSGVPPGLYLLSAHVERTTQDGQRRSLTTFFPGTTDLLAAVPIVVGTGTQHDWVDFLVVTE